MNNLFDLSGKTAIVTGGSRGIGRAICIRLAQHGAKVVVASRKLDACQAVVDEITANGGTAMAHAASISRKEDLQGLVDATIAAWGKVDILVCNAALNPYFGPSQEISDEAYDRIMNGNVRSNLWLSQMVIPAMAARGQARDYADGIRHGADAYFIKPFSPIDLVDRISRLLK